MASPQLENGFIKISNEVLDNIIRNPEIMRGALFPVIAVIWRKTWGWNKKEDAISISQFVDATGYSKRTIIYALQELEAKNVIVIKRGCHGLIKDTNIIYFNKDYESWLVQNSAPQVKTNRGSAKLRKKVVQNSAKKVQSFAHTKDIKYNTKDSTKNMKKETYIDYESGEEVELTKPKKTSNKEIIALAHLFEKLGEEHTGVKPDLTRAYFKIQQAMKNHSLSPDDVKSLFTHFFNNRKLNKEQKIGLSLCISGSYISQWKVTEKNRPVSQVDAASQIIL